MGIPDAAQWTTLRPARFMGGQGLGAADIGTTLPAKPMNGGFVDNVDGQGDGIRMDHLRADEMLTSRILPSLSVPNSRCRDDRPCQERQDHA